MTRWMLLGCWVAMLGCGSSSKPAEPTEPAPPADTRTELEIRRDAACEAVGPRITACAIEDARATMSAEELAKLDLETTGPAHTEEFVRECKGQAMSSRQVRVYEVCVAEETECEPLMACLDHVNDAAVGVI